MKLAGPPAMMLVLLLTKSPAPMIPPIDIMVKCRPFNERLSSYLGTVGADRSATDVVGWVIGHPLLSRLILHRFYLDP